MRCDHHRRIFDRATWRFAAVPTGSRVRSPDCLSCQAALAREKRIQRGLEQLRNTYLDPGPSLLSTLLSNGAAPVRPLYGDPDVSNTQRLNLGRRWQFLMAVSGALTVGGVIAVAVRKPRPIG